jgi:hypothetical protein
MACPSSSLVRAAAFSAAQRLQLSKIGLGSLMLDRFAGHDREGWHPLWESHDRKSQSLTPLQRQAPATGRLVLKPAGASSKEARHRVGGGAARSGLRLSGHPARHRPEGQPVMLFSGFAAHRG